MVDKQEIDLVNALDAKMPAVTRAASENDYNEVLTLLSQLHVEIDAFFEGVMVMADDEQLRHNRLAILQQIRQAFLLVADISVLANK